MNGLEAKIRELVAVEHRISNLEAILAEKVSRRDVLKAEIDAEIARKEVRLKPVDILFDRKDAPDGACVRCGRDTGHDPRARRIRAIESGGRTQAMAADDVARYDAGGIALPEGARDLGWRMIGSECIRRQGVEWTVERA